MRNDKCDRERQLQWLSSVMDGLRSGMVFMDRTFLFGNNA